MVCDKCKNLIYTQIIVIIFSKRNVYWQKKATTATPTTNEQITQHWNNCMQTAMRRAAEKCSFSWITIDISHVIKIGVFKSSTPINKWNEWHQKSCQLQQKNHKRQTVAIESCTIFYWFDSFSISNEYYLKWADPVCIQHFDIKSIKLYFGCCCCCCRWLKIDLIEIHARFIFCNFNTNNSTKITLRHCV